MKTEPCSECRSERHVEVLSTGAGFTVYCTKCGNTIPPETRRDAAITVWNQRRRGGVK